jgi:hypothetical protein
MRGHNILRFEPGVGKARGFFIFVFERDATIDADRASFYDGSTVAAYEFSEAITNLKHELRKQREDTNHEYAGSK